MLGGKAPQPMLGAADFAPSIQGPGGGMPQGGAAGAWNSLVQASGRAASQLQTIGQVAAGSGRPWLVALVVAGLAFGLYAFSKRGKKSFKSFKSASGGFKF